MRKKENDNKLPKLNNLIEKKLNLIKIMNK